MEIVPQILVLATNQPGTLANICGTLADEKITILGISIVDHIDHALIRLVVDDVNRAIHLLGESGLPVLEDKVLRLEVSGGPGTLERIAQEVAYIGLNIHYAYASEPPGGGNAYLILKTSDDEAALKRLQSRVSIL